MMTILYLFTLNTAIRKEFFNAFGRLPIKPKMMEILLFILIGGSIVFITVAWEDIARLFKKPCPECGSRKFTNLVSEDWYPLVGRKCANCGVETEPEGYA